MSLRNAMLTQRLLPSVLNATRTRRCAVPSAVGRMMSTNSGVEAFDSRSGQVATDVYTMGYNDAVVSQHARRSAEECASHLLSSLRPGMRVLDVGCGPGTITRGLAARVRGGGGGDQAARGGSVVGLDVSETVLDAARANLKDCDNVELMQGTSYELPFADNTFDVVHAHQVLQHLTDPVLALKEMKRVTKEGGTVSCREADYATMLAFPESPGIDFWRDMYHRVAWHNGAFPDAGRMVKSWALEAGYDAAHFQSFAQVTCYSSDADVKNWGLSTATRCSETELAKQAVEYGIATQEQLNDAAQAWRDWTEQPGAYFYYVNGCLLVRV